MYCSAAIEISTMMGVDAFVTKSGIKMVSTLHSNTMVKGKIQLSEGRILNAEWDLPEDRMDIISVKYVHISWFDNTNWNVQIDKLYSLTSLKQTDIFKNDFHQIFTGESNTFI